MLTHRRHYQRPISPFPLSPATLFSSRYVERAPQLDWSLPYRHSRQLDWTLPAQPQTTLRPWTPATEQAVMPYYSPPQEQEVQEEERWHFVPDRNLCVNCVPYGLECRYTVSGECDECVSRQWTCYRAVPNRFEQQQQPQGPRRAPVHREPPKNRRFSCDLCHKSKQSCEGDTAPCLRCKRLHKEDQCNARLPKPDRTVASRRSAASAPTTPTHASVRDGRSLTRVGSL